MVDEPKQIEPTELVDKLIQDDLVKYLCDSDLQKEVIDWIGEETGIKQKILIRPCVRVLAWMLVSAAKSTAKWAATEASIRWRNKLTKLPYYDRIARSLLNLKSNIDSQTADKKLVNDIISGQRPPHDAEFGNMLSQDLQVSLRKWEEFRDHDEAMKEGFDELVSLLKPQPKLDLQLLERTESNRLNYRVGRVPFLGRETELAQLEEFLYSQQGFSWWIVTGPGGMGKSRLGLELCLRNGGAWRVGFLPSDHGFTDWQNWEPDQPTLMLIDYAAGRPELHSLISTLSGRAAEFEYPVRCLLLEREASGYWWDRFIGAGTTEGYKIKAVMHKEDPIQLGPLSQENTWKTIEFILSDNEASIPDKAETLESLGKIDPEFKPLYTALAAESIAAGEDIRHWDKSDLLGDLLKREEREFWTGATDRDKNLMALATMVGGLECETLESLNSHLLPCFKSGNDNCFNQDLYERMAGRKIESTKIPPLEPDPIGEYYVLSFAKSRKIIRQKAIAPLRDLAWGVDPLSYVQFVDRLASDFSVQTEIVILSDVDLGRPHFRRLWARLTVNLIAYYDRLEKTEPARKLLDRLESLAEKYRDEPEIRLRWANGAVNLIWDYGELKNTEAARELLDRLESLAEKYRDEPEIRLEWAKGAFNLISAYGRLEKTEPARKLLDNLEALAEKYRDEPEIRLEWANGAVNLISAYGRLEKTEPARKLLDNLESLAEKYRDEPEIRLRWAEGAVNLISAYGRLEKTEPARELLDRLESLAEKHHDEPEIRLRWAEGAVNLISAYGRLEKTEPARKLLDNLESLAEKYRGEPELNSVFIRGLAALSIACAERGDKVLAREFFLKLGIEVSRLPVGNKLHSWVPQIKSLLKENGVDTD